MRKSKSDHYFALNLFLLAAVIVRLTIAYYPFIKLGYLVPPGGDPVSHANLIKDILTGHLPNNYPWLFHLIAAGISRVSGLAPMSTLKLIGPGLIVLPAFGAHYFLRNFFDKKTAFIGFIFVLFASGYGLKAFGDGNYPNLIAAGLLLPIFLTLFIKSVTTKKKRDIVWLVLVLILIILTHHLTVVFAGISVLSFVVGYYIWAGERSSKKSVLKFGALAISLIVLFGIVLFYTSFGTPYRDAIGNYFSSGSFGNLRAFSSPLDASNYGSEIGSFTFFAGMLALVYVVFLLDKANKIDRRAVYILILTWFLSFLLLSRLSVSGLPGRFTRELGLPLVLAITITISFLYKKIKTKKMKVTALVVFGIILAFNLTHFNNSSYASPQYYKSMIWYDDLDQAKTEAIKAIAGDEAIMTNEDNPYFSYYVPNAKHISYAGLGDKLIDRNLDKIKPQYIYISKEFNNNYRKYRGEDYIENNSRTIEVLEEIASDYKLTEVASISGGSKLYRVDDYTEIKDWEKSEGDSGSEQ